MYNCCDGPSAPELPGISHDLYKDYKKTNKCEVNHTNENEMSFGLLCLLSTGRNFLDYIMMQNSRWEEQL